MEEVDGQAPFSQELVEILAGIAKEHELPQEALGNMFDFVSTNVIRTFDDRQLTEEDLTAALAQATDLPICTNRHIHPSRGLMERCNALGMPILSWEPVPILEMGPGIVLAHYDPFIVIPPCFHKQNIQLVLCTWTVYRKLRDAFSERYNPPTTVIYQADTTPLPEDIKGWATWQLDYNPMEEGTKSTLKQIQATENFDMIPAEWEYWFNNKREGLACTHLGIIDTAQESQLIPLNVLKSLESVILFESAALLQIGHVQNWEHANSLDAIAEQCQRNSGRVVQKFQIIAGDYSRFLEDQINRQMNLGNYLKTDDLDSISFVDEIDPAQFANEDSIDKDDTRIKQMAELIIFRAYKIGASDILIEPQGNDFRVRFTVDGYNTIFHSGIPRNYGNSIVAHLKVRASMNITERRLPQDGKITLTIKGKPVELRAATMPVRDATVYQEEKMTMRLLSAVVSFPNLDKIGMKAEHLALLRKSLSMANGIVIVTGPTGSGKTTTLYASVQELDREKLNVVSLEDPIESYLNGITQTQINEGAGLNFANGLRAILRQAPHVILLGEIRDKEVAHIAVQAANTGHLVLTTLHTNSALGTFARLQALGTEPHQIADAVRLIMAQRLIPKLCPICRKARKSSELERVRVQKLAGVKLKEHLWQANTAGCRSCNRGFNGRRILTEIVPVDGFIRDILLKSEATLPLEQIAEHAAKHFLYKPLFTQAVDLVNEGIVDIKDAQRLFLDFGE